MKPSLEWLANPEVFEVNRIPAHSDHSCFTSEGNLRQRLDGVWKFAFTEHPDSRPVDFYKADFDTSGFDDITVPGHIQRGGEPCPYDRVLSTRIGAGAAEAILDEDYGIMIGVINGKIKRVPLAECAGKLKMVSPKDQIVKAAKQIGISFGD